MELEVIAAALFAGVSIFGGVGTMWAVVSSVVFLGSIRSLLRLNGATANELTIVTGSLLLVSVVVPAIEARVADRRHRRSPPPTDRGQQPLSPVEGSDQSAAAGGVEPVVLTHP
jgi:rhamnose transport system permease protein